ncbi:MAG: substrate-binding domain-containing protein [Anaerolineae bacterium]|nr:substrate-binding domain-containing protein [Anaerolineae bacterium]
MIQSRLARLILGTTILLAACSPANVATPTPTTMPTEPATAVTLTISGSGSVSPILAALADDFEAAYPGYVLDVLPGTGTGGGVTGVLEGVFDAAAMSRAAKDSEIEQGVEAVQFGVTSTVVIGHPDLSVTELTRDQLTGILTGAIINWSEVGGDDLPIIVYVREPDEGNTVAIRETYIGDVEFAASAVTMTSQTDMQNAVSDIEGAIGYATWATVAANRAEVKAIPVDGIGTDNSSPSLTMYMGVGYLTDRLDDIQPLISWLLSEQGRSALAAIGVSPVSAE